MKRILMFEIKFGKIFLLIEFKNFNFIKIDFGKNLTLHLESFVKLKFVFTKN